MNILKYLKKKVYLFGLFFGVSMCIFSYKTPVAKATHENTYLACFIDDSTNMYKFQVIYSGMNIEYNHVSNIWGDSLALSSASDYVGLYGLTTNIHDGSYEFSASIADNGKSSDGAVQLIVKDTHSDKEVPMSDIDYTGFDMKDDAVRPLTFPAYARACMSADINRAYEVQDALCDDFQNALLMLNDGQDYTSTSSLIQMAYYLVIAENNTIITNANGNEYKIRINSGSSGNGYIYYLWIDSLTGDSNVSQKFCYKIKKGYRDCKYGEKMENGQVNKLNPENHDKDTIYITWEHLFLEAGTLYAEGISYDNQADLYSVSTFEESVIGLLKNFFNGLRSHLQLYTFEDMIFSTGTRGSNAFAYGVYPENWNENLSTMYLVFVSIAFSLLTISCIRMVVKKELSTISVVERVSLMESMKNIVLSIFVTVFGWVGIKFIMLINYRFVAIWAAFTNGETLNNSYSAYSTIAAIVFQFAYLVITIYANYVYILRSLIVPALLVTAPLFFWLYSIGQGGMKITHTWLKVLLGNIFIQSFHAFIYGFILLCSNGLRGIESLVVCAAIIPLTRIFNDIFGLGGNVLLQTANSLAGTTTNLGLGLAGTAGQVTGSAVSGLASLTGNPLAAGAGKMLGDGIKVGAGGMQTLGGVGTNFALEDHQGSGSVNAGFNSMGRTLTEQNISPYGGFADGDSGSGGVFGSDGTSGGSGYASGRGTGGNITGGAAGGIAGGLAGGIAGGVAGGLASRTAGFNPQVSISPEFDDGIHTDGFGDHSGDFSGAPTTPMPANPVNSTGTNDTVPQMPSKPDTSPFHFSKGEDGEMSLTLDPASINAQLGSVSSTSVVGNDFMVMHELPANYPSPEMKSVAENAVSTIKRYNDSYNLLKSNPGSDQTQQMFDQNKQAYDKLCSTYGYSSMKVGTGDNGTQYITGFGSM